MRVRAAARALVLIAAITAVPPVRSADAQAQPPRIGRLSGGSAAANAPIFEAFRQGLRELGYIEGQNIVIEARWASGRAADLPRLAAELVLKPAVIVTAGTPGIRAAKRATSTIPIVMAQGSNVVGQGFVASVRQPGGNITGISTQFEDLFPKWLETLKEVVPTVSLVGALANPENPASPTYWGNIQPIAQALNVRVVLFEARGEPEFGAAFEEMARHRVGALLVMPDPTFVSQRGRIIALAEQARLPAIYAYSEIVDSGGLMSYGVNIAASFRRAATYVDKILRGANPATLPVEQAVKIELVVNMKAARAIGIAFPSAILVRADRVIE
jgi:putative ABC transport system substrate-binding protein